MSKTYIGSLINNISIKDFNRRLSEVNCETLYRSNDANHA